MRHNPYAGFVLVPVIMALVVVAALAMMLNLEGPAQVGQVAAEAEAARAERLAHAGLAHAQWQLQGNECGGDFAVATTSLDGGSYSATTTGIGTTTAYNLAVDQDAWIRSDFPTENKGLEIDQHIRFESGTIEYALFRFNLASVPTGARINAASAWFHLQAAKEHPEGPITVHRVTQDWTETGATWNSMNASFDPTVLATIPPQATGNVWVQVNLTAQVQAWVNGEPNYGILFRSTAEGVHGEYDSKDGPAGLVPRLEVIVGTTSPSPAAVQATGTLSNGNTRSLTRAAEAAYQPADAISLQLGTDPGADAMPDSFYDSRNYGGSNYVQINNGVDWIQHPLIRFDSLNIPYGAKVTSAELALYSLDIVTAGTASVHRVTRSWVEGTKSGTGQPDGSSWFTYDGTNNWASAGGDYDASVSAEADVTTTNTWVTWEVGPIVQQWQDGAANHGFLLNGDGVLKEAEFATRENANPALAPRLTINFACECGVVCQRPQGSGSILMVVGDDASPAAGDITKRALFESWGFTVTLIDDSATQAELDTALLTHDVAYISETINGLVLWNKLKSTARGVVSEEGFQTGLIGFSSMYANGVASTINVGDNGHFITYPFANGSLEIYAAPMDGLTVTGTPAPGLRVLADTGGASSLVVLDTGDELHGGGTAAGRRVMLPLGRDGSFNWAYLNNNGRLIVQRALTWATGNNTVSAGSILFVVVNPGSLTAQEDARKSLFESWGYTVNLIDESDNQTNFDAALSANNVVYVSEEVSASNLGSKLVNATIGVVNEQPGQIDDLGFGDTVVLRTRDTINIVSNTHYITEPFTTGGLTILTSTQPVHMFSGTTSADMSVLGTSDNDTAWVPSLATLAPGDALWNGGTAAGRRAQLPWGDGAFDINALNSDGETLLLRAIEWAAGAGCGVMTPLLFVVGDAASLTTGEIARQDLMTSWCYAVTLIDDNDTPGNYATAMANSDVVYVSHDVTQESVGNALRNFTIGVVNEEFLLTDELGLSGGYGSSLTTTLDIVNTAHDITAGFSAGALTIFDGNSSATGAAVGLAPTRKVLGKVSTISALMAIETGARLAGGGTAAGRRVQVPWGYDFSVLNNDGQTIMRQAIEWASETGTPGVPLLQVVSDADAPSDEEIARKQLFESWDYTVTVIEDSDSQINFDLFVAQNDVAYISEEIDPALLTTKLSNAAIGVVNEERMLYDDLGFASAIGTQSGMTAINITNNTHDITSGYGLGSQTITSSGQPLQYLQGTMAIDLTALADHPSVANPILAVLDTGDDLYGGGTAAGPRVWLPWGGDAFVFDELNNDGRAILQNSLQWAASGGGGSGGGSGGVSFEGFSEAKRGSNGTTLDVPKPAGTLAGDLLILALATDGDTDSSMAVPAGWTEIDASDNGGDVSFGVWWKIAGGSEPADYALSWSGNERAYGMVMNFRGHDPANPIDDTAKEGDQRSDPISRAVTTTADNTLVLRLGAFDNDKITLDSPGLTGHTAITMDSSDGSNFSVSAGAGYVVQASAGDSGTSSFTLTGSEEYRTVTIAIAPQ